MQLGDRAHACVGVVSGMGIACVYTDCSGCPFESTGEGAIQDMIKWSAIRGHYADLVQAAEKAQKEDSHVLYWRLKGLDEETLESQLLLMERLVPALSGGQ